MDACPPKRSRIRKSRGRGLRTRNGCITCRKRHLKCDEIKPLCGPCAKNDKACQYAPSGHSVNPTSVTAENVPVATRDAGLSCLSQVADAQSPQPAILDPLPTVDTNVNHSPLSLQYTHLSPSNASFAAVQWFGLLASDAARESPQLSTNAHCDPDGNLVLHHAGHDGPVQPSALQQATQVLDSPSSSGGYDQTDASSPESRRLGEEQIWQFREPIDLLPAEQTLFEHFVNEVSPWMDLFDPTNQFSTFVPHLAIHNAGLMNAILALAFRHLALNPRLDTENLPCKAEAALQYYYQTLHYVQRAMRYSSYKTSLELLATTLIISAYEMLDNSTSDWERHLEGVFLIQRSQTIHGESGGLHSAVWWAWLCQDIWAAFREKRKTFTFWIPQRPLSALLPHELAARVIYITAKVVSYCAEVATKDNIQQRMDGALRLHAMLNEWKQHLTLEFSPLPLGSREHSTCFRPIWIRPPAFAVAMQFFNVSYILLLAHEPTLGGVDQFLTRQRTIKRCAEDICGISMTLKDTASTLMSSQALFIAGIFIQDPRARESVLELLDSCHERTGWPVSSLGVELQEIWESNERTEDSSTGKAFMPSV